MHMLVGLAAKIQIEIPRGAEGEPCGALHLKVWRGRLVQLGLLVVEIPERHRRPARLEENVAEYSLEDESKALRVLIDYAMEEVDPEHIFASENRIIIARS